MHEDTFLVCGKSVEIKGNPKTGIIILKSYYWWRNFCPTAYQLIVVYFTYSLYLFISFRTMVVITIFSQYLKKVKVPLPAYSRQRGMHVIRFPLFRLFPVSWVHGDWDAFKRPYNSAWLITGVSEYTHLILRPEWRTEQFLSCFSCKWQSSLLNKNMIKVTSC